MLNLTARRFSAPPRGRPGAPSCSFQGVPFGDEAEKGRRMTTTFDLGCQRMLYSFPRDGRSSASFLPAPDLTDRGLAAFHKCRCSGCAQAGISFGTLLAFDWSWTRHVVCGSAGLGTAGMAVRGAVLTSVSRSPSQATFYSRGPCMSTQFFLPSQWERFVEGCEDLLPTCKISPR